MVRPKEKSGNLQFYLLTFISDNYHRKKNRREEYRVKLHPPQRQVSLTLFVASTLVFTLDTFETLPYVLFRYCV